MALNFDLPIGSIALWPEYYNPPACWKFMDGTSISSSTYPYFFEQMGISDSTYTLPDMSNRCVFGKDTTITKLATLGHVSSDTEGETAHKLVLSEIPSHTHATATCSSSGGHTHQTSAASAMGGKIAAVDSWSKKYYGSTQVNGPSNCTSSHVHTVYTNDKGSDVAHNNMQPYIMLRYIMYIGGAG